MNFTRTKVWIGIGVLTLVVLAGVVAAAMGILLLIIPNFFR